MRRHPLLWKLALLQISFCLLLTWFIWIWGLSAERSTYFLSAQERDYLRDYAQQAQDIWREQAPTGWSASPSDCLPANKPGSRCLAHDLKA